MLFGEANHRNRPFQEADMPSQEKGAELEEKESNTR